MINIIKLYKECKRVGIINKSNQLIISNYNNKYSQLSKKYQEQLQYILINICNNNYKLLKYCLINNTLDIHLKCPFCEKDRKFNGKFFYKTCGDIDCWKKQHELTSLKKYGVKNPFQAKECKEKSRQTYFNKTGYYYNSQNPEVREKRRQSYYKKHGYYHNFQNPDCLIKRDENYFNKTGFHNPSQNPEIKIKKEYTCMSNHKVKYFVLSNNFNRYDGKYRYNNIFFRSSYELVFYKWCIDHDISIVYEPKDNNLYYYINNIKHEYIPDFQISYNDNNRLVEISSDYTWSTKSSEKKKLMEDNNVLVLLDKDIKKYFDYCRNINFNIDNYINKYEEYYDR